jgi:hypothetical protein
MHLENLSDGLTPRVKRESMSQERSFVFTLQAILTDAPNQMHIRPKNVLSDAVGASGLQPTK